MLRPARLLLSRQTDRGASRRRRQPPVPHELGLQTVWRRLGACHVAHTIGGRHWSHWGVGSKVPVLLSIAIVERAPSWRTPARRNGGHRGRPILEGQGGS